MAYKTFQPAQPNAIRLLNKNYNDNEYSKWSFRKLSKSNNSWKKQDVGSLQKANAWELAVQFGKRTTIHGLNRLLSDALGKYERCVWLLAVVFALFSAIYVCLIISRRYNAGNFQTVVDSTRYPVYKISYPTVTICNKNRINWSKIEEAKKKYLGNETSQEIINLFEDIVGTYDDVRFAGFEVFADLEGKALEKLSKVNFTNVVEDLTWRCSDVLKECIWRHYKQKCCDIFSLRRSKYGLCLAFNTLETAEGRLKQKNDPMWPWRAGSSGPTNGLTVRYFLHPEKHYPKRINNKGVSVMISEPLVWHTSFNDVPVNTLTHVSIEPIVYYYDNETRGTSSSARQCVFDEEKTSKDFKSLANYIYMIENCQAECHQEYLNRYCNCSLDILFPPGQHKPCQAADLPCLARNNIYFKYSHQPGEEKYVENQYDGMICKCFRNCRSLNYIVDVRPTFLPEEVHRNMSYVDLDVHFRFDSLMVYRTSLVFGWVDLIVSFGGIAGLFLGCSLISVIELAYFSLIEMPKFVYNKVQLKLNERKAARKGSMPPEKTLDYHKYNNRSFKSDNLQQFSINAKANKIIDNPNNWNQKMPSNGYF